MFGMRGETKRGRMSLKFVNDSKNPRMTNRLLEIACEEVISTSQVGV
jgi:hypothetical protein